MTTQRFCSRSELDFHTIVFRAMRFIELSPSANAKDLCRASICPATLSVATALRIPKNQIANITEAEKAS